MSSRKTLGGERLGAGKKMTVDLKSYERSSHDLSSIWRTTMSAGTLVPFMQHIGLPGDTFDINLGADVKTYPTVGPLFGSFKLQLDVFSCPIRLYQAQLHNNKLGIGMEMSKIKLPVLEFLLEEDRTQGVDWDVTKGHISTSSILAYLGIRGTGQINGPGVQSVKFNGLGLLSYWDIFKNYYANKQEEYAYVVDISMKNWNSALYEFKTVGVAPRNFGFENNIPFMGDIKSIMVKGGEFEKWELKFLTRTGGDQSGTLSWAENIFTTVTETGSGVNRVITCTGLKDVTMQVGRPFIANGNPDVGLKRFPLKNIDDMRENILQAVKDVTPFTINKDTIMPYGGVFKQRTDWEKKIVASGEQSGLAVKTYQSDIFNNWLNTEWIDGDNGISAITAISTAEGDKFTIDTLNLSQKVYDMLNRIAVSGGSYDDWMSAVWDHESYRKAESPIYHGGLSKEVVFQEVTSNAETETDSGLNPLGSLAGKGGLAQKHKGGSVTIKVDEPTIIMGIVSLTPRVDYSQGNEWFTSLMTMDDFHKPALDQIGFQELITDQMACWDRVNNNGKVDLKSAGKQPAWINYMTNFDKTYGNFADPEKEMYMTLNRRYDYDEGNKTIKDLTTYIDPSKYNYLFAQTELSAMNFWVQIATDVTARRKMSAKIIPNL